jgi:hypothetical protein
MKKLSLAVMVTLAFVSAAHAEVQIKMKAGAQCWAYQGHDTRFYGDFTGGQFLTVTFVLQQATDDGGITTRAYNSDAVWVNGPAGYGQAGKDAVWANDPAQAPKSDPNAFISTEGPGRYTFNLMEHGSGSDLPVFFQLCAMKKT